MQLQNINSTTFQSKTRFLDENTTFRPSKPKANSQDKPKSEVSTVIKSESKNTPPKQEIASNNTSNYPSQTPSTRDTDIRKEFIKTIQASIEKSPIKVMKSNEFLSGGIQDQ